MNKRLIALAVPASLTATLLLTGCMPDVATTAGTAAELKRQELQNAEQDKDKVLKSMQAANENAAAQAAQAASAADDQR